MTTETQICTNCERTCETEILEGAPMSVVSHCCKALVANSKSQVRRLQAQSNGVTLVKCPTPGCNNGIRASRELFCPDCLKKHQRHQPEAR